MPIIYALLTLFPSLVCGKSGMAGGAVSLRKYIYLVKLVLYIKTANGTSKLTQRKGRCEDPWSVVFSNTYTRTCEPAGYKARLGQAPGVAVFPKFLVIYGNRLTSDVTTLIWNANKRMCIGPGTRPACGYACAFTRAGPRL